MDETKWRALVAQWETPPPEVAAEPPTPAQAEAEGAAFMAFMGAHAQLQAGTR